MPLIQEDGHADYPLEELLRSEGIRSWASTLLRRGGSGVGMLSLSSAHPGAFPRADEAFFGKLAALLEDRLLELAILDSR
jgi:hypothetical protein